MKVAVLMLLKGTLLIQARAVAPIDTKKGTRRGAFTGTQAQWQNREV